MRHDEVLHVCRAVSDQIDVVRLFALGSQAVHVLVKPDAVPEQLTASVERDVVVLDPSPIRSNRRSWSPAQSVRDRTSTSRTATTPTG